MWDAITNIYAICWLNVMAYSSRVRACVASCWQQGSLPPESSGDDSIAVAVSAMRHLGMLVQIDGSRHAWLEERGPWLCLLAAIDDASGKLAAALFREEEDASLLLSLSAADAGAARSASGALP
jgi:hypothetical protein